MAKNPKGYDQDNIRFNQDETVYIQVEVQRPYDAVHRDLKDLRLNGEEWISASIKKNFIEIQEERCNKCTGEQVKQKKKIKIHTWWLVILSVAIIIIYVLLWIVSKNQEYVASLLSM